MIATSGSMLPFLALAFPLALAPLGAVPPFRRHALWLLPVAPVPALCLTLVAGEPAGEVGFVLLGVVLALDGLARPFVALAAVLWAMAGLAAAAGMAGDRKAPVFVGFWCLTLTGNLGVFLARDVATFYVSFAAMSLAAYVLVVHDGTEKVLRAGRIYLALTVLGETCLLAGLLIGLAGAPGHLVEEVRAGIAASPLRDVAVLLLIAGFGLKAGLMPLHLWLPLAHPAAPVAASAVLSGAIVKAGIFGLIAFLPADASGWGSGLLVAGLASAFLAAALGVTQRDAKAVLAYSTISQMGLAIALIGAGLAHAAAGGTTGPSYAAAAAWGALALFCVHHGLAKGALFLAVGVMGASGGRPATWVFAGAALAALSVAGLPMTAGAVAKAAMKESVGTPWAVLAVTLSATGTTLLLLRFLQLLRRKAAGEERAPPPGLVLPFAGLVAAALILPWLILPVYSALPPSYAIAGGALWSASWPPALAVILAWGALRLRLRRPEVPEGDLVVLLERAAEAVRRGLVRASAIRPEAVLQRLAPARSPWRVPPIELALTRWSSAGLLLIVLAVALLASLVV